MFGYVLPKKELLQRQDHIMFQSLYCGICIAIKNDYGNIPRLTTNYDITVFGLLAIEALKPPIEFETKRCIADARKKAVVKYNDFMQKLSAVNILLSYYKAKDDVTDSGGKKRLVRYLLKKPYAKAKALMPNADEIIDRGYANLRQLELENCAVIDKVCDCFATLLEELMADFISPQQESGAISEREYQNMRKLCYNVGKFVYIADALDDITDDYKSKSYNPFLAKYPDFKGRKEFLADNADELSFLLNSTVNRAIECSNSIVFTQVNDLLRNIIYEGLRQKASQLLTSEKKLPPPKL